MDFSASVQKLADVNVVLFISLSFDSMITNVMVEMHIFLNTNFYGFWVLFYLKTVIKYSTLNNDKYGN